MLSKSSKYGIRGVLYLALNSNENRKFSPTTIAKYIGVPAPFLAKTLQLLAKNHLVSSSKGRHGGFYLSDKNKQNSLIAIVDCIDGLDKFESCIIGLPVCSNENPCPMHDRLAPLRRAMVEELTNKSIEEFTNDLRSGKTHIFL